MTSAVARVSPLVQQEILHLRRAREDKLVRCRSHQDPLLHHAEFDFQDLLQMLRPQGFEDHDLVDSVHELWGELTARGLSGGAINFVVQALIHNLRLRRETESTIDKVAHLACPQVRGHNNDALREVHAAVVAECERSLVEDAEQKLPEGVRRLLDFVKEQDRKLKFVGVPLVERLLGKKRMRLAMAEIARRRADQFGDFVRVLELGAIDLDAGAGVAEERLGEGFDYASLARSGRTKEQEVADGASGGVESSEKHLIDLNDLFDGRVLANAFATESSFKVPGIAAPASRVKNCAGDGLHIGGALLSFSGRFNVAAISRGMT